MLLNNHLFAIGPRRELSVDGVCGPHSIDAIQAYQRYASRVNSADGLIYPRNQTMRRLLEHATIVHTHLVKQVHLMQKLQSSRAGHVANVDQVALLPKPLAATLHTPEAHVAAGTGQAGHKYTDSPLEIPRSGTLVDPLQLPGLLQKAWPQLTVAGARLITAQYMGETTGGKSCWNYNLGNVKCADPKTHLHQYLPGTWEYWSAEMVRSKVASDKNARYATPAEIKAKVGTESGGKKVIFFKPPDLFCCFLAYHSLAEGVDDWTNFYKRKAKKHPELLGGINKGDYVMFTKVLCKDGYYSQDEAKYVSSMKKQKEYLDRILK